MIKKTEVHAACMAAIDERIIFLKNLLANLQNGAESDAKSSAGDKHETAISQMQLEQEKINKQLAQAMQNKSLLLSINPQLVNETAEVGALVQTDSEWLYILASLGKISINHHSIMVISAQTPAGIALKGKKPGDCVQVLQKYYTIKAVY